MLHVLVLAAGEGTRMRSSLPKVLHRVAGAPLVTHVVRAAQALEPASIHVVVPSAAETVREALADVDVSFAVQDPPAGTADAVAVGCRALAEDTGILLVLNGDSPGIRTETLAQLVARHHETGASATCMVTTPGDPSGYGRVVRDERGQLSRIIEEADASAEERTIPEVNAGFYCFSLEPLGRALQKVQRDNVQSEYYLTDAIGLLREADGRVQTFHHRDAEEVHGVNTRTELARAEALLRRRAIESLMEGGVTFKDPDSTYIDADVTVGCDTILYPGVVLEAGTVVGSACAIYPNVRISRSRLGDRVTILDGSVVEDSVVEDDASIGPYARLRPGSEIGPAAKLGNFVETKATRIGAGSKANHLSYLGDAEIGKNVNVGAGTITCNYDGVAKHRTVIEDGAFIGSNTALVAPVRIGAGAYVAAGSTITEDVLAGALGIARARQTVKKGWSRARQRAADGKRSSNDEATAGASAAHDETTN